MKRLFLGVGLLMSLTACGKEIKGRGQVEEHVFSVKTAANELAISHDFEVLMTSELAPGQIKIYTQANIMPYITLSDDADQLHIGMKKGYDYDDVTLRLEVSTRQYSDIEASGSSEVEVKGVLAHTDLKISLSGASEFKGQIEADVLDLQLSGASEAIVEAEVDDVVIDMSGSSEVDLLGIGQVLELEISGASELNGYDFLLDDIQVDASGASEVRVYCEDLLQGEISGASVLYYKGSPRVIDVKNTGGSTLESK